MQVQLHKSQRSKSFFLHLRLMHSLRHLQRTKMLVASKADCDACSGQRQIGWSSPELPFLACCGYPGSILLAEAVQLRTYQDTGLLISLVFWSYCCPLHGIVEHHLGGLNVSDSELYWNPLLLGALVLKNWIDNEWMIMEVLL